MSLQSIWNWFSVEENRNTLGFICTGLAAVIGGLWVVFQYFSNKPKNRQKDTISVEAIKEKSIIDIETREGNDISVKKVSDSDVKIK